MESLGIIHALWRRRVVAGLGVLIAAGISFLAMYRVSVSPLALEDRSVTTGYARERALVDTPKSLVVDARPEGALSIHTRAVLLAELMAGDEAREAIARGIDVPSSDIAIDGPGTAAPTVPTPLASRALEVTQSQRPYSVQFGVDSSLPILSISTLAPSAADAAELADAATASLAGTADRRLTSGGSLEVRRLGRPSVGTTVGGIGRLKALILGAFLAGVWCLAVVAFQGVGTGGRGREGIGYGSNGAGCGGGSVPSMGDPA